VAILERCEKSINTPKKRQNKADFDAQLAKKLGIGRNLVELSHMRGKIGTSEGLRDLSLWSKISRFKK
jgi:hypothetical protein